MLCQCLPSPCQIRHPVSLTESELAYLSLPVLQKAVHLHSHLLPFSLWHLMLLPGHLQPHDTLLLYLLFPHCCGESLATYTIIAVCPSSLGYTLNNQAFCHITIFIICRCHSVQKSVSCHLLYTRSRYPGTGSPAAYCLPKLHKAHKAHQSRLQNHHNCYDTFFISFPRLPLFNLHVHTCRIFHIFHSICHNIYRSSPVWTYLLYSEQHQGSDSYSFPAAALHPCTKPITDHRIR